MTQEKLEMKLMYLLSVDDVAELKVREFVELINQHVAEVIGEDEREKQIEKPDMNVLPPNWPQLDKWVMEIRFRRNELRAEQRKRGGL